MKTKLNKFKIYAAQNLLNMKISYLVISGIVLIGLGVLLAAGPWTIFPVCEALDPPMYVTTSTGKQLPMPCGYTARAEIGVGALVVLGGVGMMLAKSPGTRKGLAWMGLGAGALAIAIPTALIGVCANQSHPCVLETQPALILIGATVAMLSIIILWKAR
jgi:hypothetical protein